MYGAYYIFSKPFFRGWVVVSILWLFAGLLVVTFLPPIEGRHSIWATIAGQRHYKNAVNLPGVAPRDTASGEKASRLDKKPSSSHGSGSASPNEGHSQALHSPDASPTIGAAA